MEKGKKEEDKIALLSIVNAGLEISPFLQSGTAKKCAGMATFVISLSDELANYSHPRTKAISRNDSFHSGMAVSLTCQSCVLESPQRLILPLEYSKKIENNLKSTLYLKFVVPVIGKGNKDEG